MDKRIKKGVELIFKSINVDYSNIDKGLVLLESARCDKNYDASFILAYFYATSGYKLEFLTIKKDDILAKAYLTEAIIGGSALATIGGLAMKLLSHCKIKKLMKFDSFKEAYLEVLDRAQDGDCMCQYVIAEVYYKNNIYLIDGLDKSNVDVSIQRGMKRMCVYWYEKSMESGLYIGFINHAHMYMEYDAISLQDEMSYRNVLEKVADAGYLDGKIAYAMYLYKKSYYKESKLLFEELSKLGYKKADYYLNDIEEMEKSSCSYILGMMIRKKISKIISKINYLEKIFSFNKGNLAN